MFKSATGLSETARVEVSRELNARLADGIDLYTQVKVAHWNLKGPSFGTLHPLFDEFATRVSTQNDEMAERAVILGARAYGTARHVASASKLAEYPGDTTKDVDHTRLLAERYDAYAANLRASRKVAEQHGDTDTVDMLTETMTAVEKDAWFLHATLGE